MSTTGQQLGIYCSGWAFRKLYVVPQVCEPGTPCAQAGIIHQQRVIFWAVTIPLLGLLAFPWFAPLLY
jgi:mercuric ion transport protein